MKTELQKKLLAKYPEFFQTELKIYTGEKPTLEEVGELLNQKEMVLPIQFGFECGDGWYMLLDELMGDIKNHLENENHHRANEFKYKWMWNFQRWLRTRTSSKQERLRKFADWLYEKAPRAGRQPLTIQITQIKEKFGGLRFYFFGGDDYIDGLTSLAEGLSYRICEYCGTTINIGYTKGWICTICKTCHQKNERTEGLTWEPRKES